MAVRTGKTKASRNLFSLKKQGIQDKLRIVIIPSVAATARGFSGRAGAVLLGWLPCWESWSACLPGRAAQAARCPLAVCGFWDLLTLTLPKGSPSLDFFLIHMMDEKTVILQAEE